VIATTHRGWATRKNLGGTAAALISKSQKRFLVLISDNLKYYDTDSVTSFFFPGPIFSDSSLYFLSTAFTPPLSSTVLSLPLFPLPSSHSSPSLPSTLSLLPQTGTATPKGEVFLGGCQVVFTGSATFIVSSPSRDDQIWICDNDEEARLWVDVIGASISRVDFKISHVWKEEGRERRGREGRRKGEKGEVKRGK
jgi:hypothetical protein